MAIIQISKIQQRAGDLVDLPQLDEAEFGFATDEKRLFIGKTTDEPENIEVLTSYSDVSFSQIQGAVGNLNIDPVTLEDGQVLAYNATDNAWENRGGNAGGQINLGNVSNLSITGGAIGYVLQTDGTGNLSWQPKGVVTLYIENITQSINSVVTFTNEFALNDGQLVTITGVTGMTEVNGQNYYLGNLTTTTANLYTDAGLTTALDTTGFGAFPYTSVTDTTTVTNDITVGSAADFNVDDAVQFVGTTFGGLEANKTYYILSASGTTITVSETLGGSEVLLATDTGSCNVYVIGGKAVATVSGGGGGNTGTSSNTQVLFNLNNVPAGDSKLTFDYTTGIMTLTGNAIVGNLTSSAGNVRANILVSTVTTGTAPITVASTTKVTNLNADLLDGYDSSQSAVASTVVVRDVNANIVANNFTGANLALTGTLSVTGNANVGNIGSTNGVFTGNITAGNVYANSGTIGASLLTGTLTTAAQPNVTSLGTLTGLGVNGTVTAVNITANTGIFTGNGSGLTNLAGANVTGQVANALVAGTVYVAAQPNITSVGTLTSLAVTGNITAGNVYANSGTIGASLLTGTLTTAAQPNITSVGTLTSLTVSGNANVGNIGATNGVFTGNVSVTGNLSAAFITGTMVTTNITTGANTTAGTITGNWTLTAGSRLQATYADLAEYYAADANYIPGTVLEFGGEHEVTIAKEETSKLAGVVSSDPAYVMNGNIQAEHPVILALIGRVPVRATGYVSKGDMLVSAGNGLAKATVLTPKIGTVIGKAITNKWSDGEGVVEVLVGRM